MRLLGCVLPSMVLTACWGGTGREEPKMDMQQAGERAEEILDGTMAAIRPPVKWERDNPSQLACDNGLNRPIGATSVYRGRTILTVVSERRRGELLELVQRYWKQQGFGDFETDSDAHMPQIRATSADGLVVILDVGDIGNVYFTAGFSCAKDSEMTYPSGTPGLPWGVTKADGIPRKYSAHWSETAPH
ncbi:hypothetical protein [Streptomyces sp. NBC_00523]|uniref:hypothetical protein n=2 Tax=unclassified Streptomyces TaxID=2593676 RepID=UPI002E814FA8|nr:hypothetical protein [Streptomyces sp. NBC_00523]